MGDFSQSGTMKSYHRFKSISPITERFANTSPASGIKSEINFTNYNKNFKTPVAEDKGQKIETFFEAYNSRNQGVGNIGGTVPTGLQSS